MNNNYFSRKTTVKMELNGKCEEDFEEWFNESDILSLNRLHIFNASPFDRLKIFYKMDASMQWGVLVDFFDSNAVYVEVSFYGGATNWRYEISLRENDRQDWTYLAVDEEGFNNPTEARTAAITKACEIYNTEKR